MSLAFCSAVRSAQLEPSPKSGLGSATNAKNPVVDEAHWIAKVIEHHKRIGDETSRRGRIPFGKLEPSLWKA